MQLLSEMFERSAKESKEKPAVLFEEKEVTYQELKELTDKMTNGLQEMGIEPGERILEFMTNRIEFVISHFGIIKSGATAVPINVMYKPYEIVYIANDTQAKGIVTESHLFPIVLECMPQIPTLKYVIVLGETIPEGTLSFQSLISKAGTTFRKPDASVDDIVSIIYTSGTTGKPKGATQTHRSIYMNVIGDIAANKLTSSDRLVCALPLFNNFALSVLLMPTFFIGGSMVLVDRFEAGKVLDRLSRFKGTYYAGTPTMYIYLLEHLDPKIHNLQSLRVVNSGGAHCPYEVIKDFEDKFGADFLDGYGFTEGCGFSTLSPLVGIRKKNSVGIPISNIRVKVVDDYDQEVPKGTVGEICDKGDHHSIHCYWNNSEANTKSYRGGWFYSGDMGYLDEDGYLYITDRKADLIITGGQNIYPVEVEQIIYTHPKVAMAAVIGIPDKVKGELAKAYIVLKPGESTTEQEIIEFVRSRIAKYKAPRLVEFVKSLPQGPTGKILKRELREEILKSKR
ncbi:MAG: long-chain fatty acid--CoA ligase [Deltaproteobacteria bacterium]|nr:long-chain fatty acid--CoA ligase [Deltaproteobacteria bacterium]